MRTMLAFTTTAMIAAGVHCLTAGCTTSITTPVVISEVMEHKRHRMLDEFPLPATVDTDVNPAADASPSPTATPPDIFIDRFVYANEDDTYFSDLWAVPFLPYVDSYYGLLDKPDDHFGGDLISVELDLPAPPDEENSTEVRRYCYDLYGQLKARLADVSVPAENTAIFRRNMVLTGGGPIELMLEDELAATFPHQRVESAVRDGRIEQHWLLREDFTVDDFCDLMSAARRTRIEGLKTIVYLDQQDHVRLETTPQPPAMEPNSLRIIGTIHQCDLETRRMLYGVTFIGSGYLSLLGLPQSKARYRLEMVLTALDGRGRPVASHTISLETNPGTGRLYSGYETMAQGMEAEFEYDLESELTAFAAELKALGIGAKTASNTGVAQTKAPDQP